MTPDRLRLCLELPPPARGESRRATLGTRELVLEGVRSGFTLLWHAGREARRYVLGLSGHGTLVLELRPPRHPIALEFRETLVLAPGARVRGYVQVPLVPTLLWKRDDERGTSELLELAPAGLSASWSDDRAIFSASSPWFVRFPVHQGEAHATVPLWLRNAGDESASPQSLELRLAASELVEARGAIVARPQRRVWDGASWRDPREERSEVAR